MKLAQHAKSSLVLVIALSALLSSLPAAGARAQRRRTAPPAAPQRPQDEVERKVNALVARMTLEEKLGQLQQLGGDVGGHANPDIYDIARRGLLGSTLGVRGARNTNDLQRAAVEGSRLHIPLIFGFDVIHGYRTIFPIPLGEAASFDPAAPPPPLRLARYSRLPPPLPHPAGRARGLRPRRRRALGVGRRRRGARLR